MEKVFYTAEQKNVLKRETENTMASMKPMTQATGIMILDVLGEQQNTLQNIESILQRIEKAIGANKEKFIPEICDNEGNIRKCYGKPTTNPEN